MVIEVADDLFAENARALARAGLAEQARPGAIAALATALSWEPAPWSPTIF